MTDPIRATVEPPVSQVPTDVDKTKSTYTEEDVQTHAEALLARFSDGLQPDDLIYVVIYSVQIAGEYSGLTGDQEQGLATDIVRKVVELAIKDPAQQDTAVEVVTRLLSAGIGVISNLAPEGGDTKPVEDDGVAKSGCCGLDFSRLTNFFKRA